MSGPKDSLLKERLDELVELGLSQAQAHVYVVLLSLGPSIARTVSRVSGLGREDTYRALRFLKSIGLVEVTMDNPYTFAAVEPSVGIRMLVSHLENKFSQLKEKANKVGMWLEGLDRVRTTNETPEDKVVFKLEGGSQIFERMSKLILSCKSELVRITSSTGISQNYILGVFEQEKQITKNGVNIRAITEENSSNHDILAEYSRFVDLRFLEGVGSSLKFVIADDSQMIFFTTNPTRIVRDLGAIWTNNKPLIEGFKKEFEACWSVARPARKPRAENGARAQVVSDKLPHPSGL
jgi:sugar-specific transcriptional regulator TrmB